MIVVLRSQVNSLSSGRLISAVYGQAVSAFKGRDRATGLRPDNSVDYAVVVTELAEGSLHRYNH